jgi:DNA mismatch endonuclease (patch repair protein)
MSDRISVRLRSENMRRIKSKNTSPELLVRRLVYALGYRYRLHRKDLPGRPDLVFGPRRKIIFVHGCFWHQHDACRAGRTPNSNVEYWTPKLALNLERDRKAIEALQAAGWAVMIVWECRTRDVTALQFALSDFLDGSGTSRA